MKNYMKLELAAISENESFARSAVAAFALPLNPTVAELADIKTAVSEAVTNCVVHAYKNSRGAENTLLIECIAEEDGKGGLLHITVTDHGCGIENIAHAITPFYTTLQGEERSGMGFTIMQTFMSDFSVKSEKEKGTTVWMSKRFGGAESEAIG
ncbi:MAG: anti-sigma F factor [Clostridia bacterium]|nr:anti-sigma F factor [Clostridia bacterium]